MTDPASKPTQRDYQAALTRQESQRSELAQMVHDTLCQTLCSAALMLKVRTLEIQAGKSLTVAQMKGLGEMLNRALAEARHTVRQLQPVAPSRDGLMVALARLASETSGQRPCEFHCEAAVFVDAAEGATALYRLAEGAVQNLLTQAGTGSIAISLAVASGSIALQVSGAKALDGLPPSTGAVPEQPWMKAYAKAAGITCSQVVSADLAVSLSFTLPWTRLPRLE